MLYCESKSIPQIITVVFLSFSLPISAFFTPSRHANSRSVTFHHILIFTFISLLFHIGGMLGYTCSGDFTRDDGVISDIDLSYFFSSGTTIFFIAIFSVYSVDEDMKDAIMALFTTIILQIFVSLSIISYKESARKFYLVCSFMLPLAYLFHALRETKKQSSVGLSNFIRMTLFLLCLYTYGYVIVATLSPFSLNKISYHTAEILMCVFNIGSVFYVYFILVRYGWSFQHINTNPIIPGTITNLMKISSREEIISSTHSF
jgi:hypothetical protein